MSDDEKPPIVIDGTRVVCPDHGIRGERDCCGDAEPKVDPDEETGFDIIKAIEDLVKDPLEMAVEDFEKSNREIGISLPSPLIIDDNGPIDWDKVTEEITDSLSHKMAVISTEKGRNWWLDYINGASEKLEREFLYGPSGKPGPEPRGLFRVDIVDPDPEC